MKWHRKEHIIIIIIIIYSSIHNREVIELSYFISEPFVEVRFETDEFIDPKHTKG